MQLSLARVSFSVLIFSSKNVVTRSFTNKTDLRHLSHFTLSNQRIMNQNRFKRYKSNLAHLENLTSQRITSLSATDRNDSLTRDYSRLNREEELQKLVQIMNLKPNEIKKMLNKQRQKLPDGNEKKTYINWLLHSDENSNSMEVPPVTTKRDSSDNQDVSASKKSRNDDQKLSKNQSSFPVRPRPIRATSKAMKDETIDQSDTKAISTFSTADKTLLSNVKFETVDAIHPLFKRALKHDIKVEHMTEIQAKTFPIAMEGKDVLGRARTGTGKTLAFLIPALQRYLISKDSKSNQGIGVLVVSPTRELAIQIGDQAELLLSHFPDLKCHVMYGGSSISRDTRVLNKSLPSVLIATPGRLIDHLDNLTLGSGRKFGYDVMRNTEILVLDETDRLLDMGFRREIDKIMAYLPKKDKRQTFLFSATIPSDLKVIMSKYMKSDFVEVDCIKDGGNDDGSGTHTNTLVDQTYAILPSMEHSIEAVVKLILDAVEKDDKHKLVVFFPTARMVGFYADFFRLGLGIEVSELHSKKSQGARNKTSAQFRESKKGILFTSDVSARGVDYPDVTTVLQFGLPESREQYIHRLGRCGRAGKTGKGMLILAPFEARFLNELKGIEIKKDTDAENVIAAPLDQRLGGKMDSIFQRIRSGDQQLCTRASQAYQSFLGFYISNIKRLDVRDKAELLEIGNQYATRVIGMKEIPGLTKKAAKFMGILGMPGVRIVSLENVKSSNNKKVKK